MKKLSFLILFLALLGTSACNNKHGGDASGVAVDQVVAVDLPPECQTQQANYQQLADWDDYRRAGCQPYDYDNGHFRHLGCPRNTFAACGPGIGMICMPAAVYHSHRIAWYVYNDGSPRARFCGYKQRGDTENECSYRDVQGAGQIGRACLVGDLNGCEGAGICQPIDNSEFDRASRPNDRPGDRPDDQQDDQRGRRPARPDGSWRVRRNRIGVCIQ